MSKYHQDFYAWTQEQAQLLKVGQLSAIDIENIIDEIESMGRSEKRALSSRLEVLLTHLLKWQYQVALRGKSWDFTIKEQRRRLTKLLKDNPSLYSWLHEAVLEAYVEAIQQAEIETGLHVSVFLDVCPWTVEQVLDFDFYPN